MQFIPRLRRKLLTTIRRHQELPDHYRTNLVDHDVKMAEPTWLADVDATALLVFVHVPKAAGTSLNTILWQVYGRRYVNYHPTLSSRSTRKMIEKRPHQILALGAHMPFGFHLSFTRASRRGQPKKMFADRTCRYVTVLRDPVERMKSYYRFVTTFPAHRLHRETKGMSPDVFFRHMRNIDNRECCNLQCDLVGLSRNFETARDHLLAHYHAVGVVERMDDFVCHLKTTMNWPDVFEVKHRNASPTHIHDDDFGQDVIDWITENNAEDIKLYQYAKAHLAPDGKRQGQGQGQDPMVKEPLHV